MRENIANEEHLVQSSSHTRYNAGWEKKDTRWLRTHRVNEIAREPLNDTLEAWSRPDVNDLGSENK